MTGAGGRPTKAQAAARDEALLDAARLLFCERGFAGATIDEIAARLRWSKHTIYSRYAGKLEILEAVVGRDVVRFIAALEQASDSGGDAIDALRNMARAYFGFSTSPGYSALYAAVALEASTSEHLSAKLMQWASASLAPLREGIVSAAPHTGWRSGDADEICGVLIDLLDGEGNRVKWSGSHADVVEVDRRFAFRWEMFLRATSL